MGAGVEHVIEILRDLVVGQRVQRRIDGRPMDAVPARRRVAAVQHAQHCAERAGPCVGQAVDVEVAADQHRLVGRQAHAVDQVLDGGKLPGAQRRAVGARLQVGGKEMEAPALLADPGVEHTLLGEAVLARAERAEGPLEFQLDRPFADDDDAAVLAEAAVVAQHARLMGVVVRQRPQQLAAVPVAEQLLQQQHVVASELARHERHALVLVLGQEGPQIGVEGEHVQRDPRRGPGRAGAARGRLGREPGRRERDEQGSRHRDQGSWQGTSHVVSGSTWGARAWSLDFRRAGLRRA